MKMMLTVAVAAALVAVAALPAAAQPVTFRGFATAGQVVDNNRSQILGVGGGVLVDAGQPWVSAGAQGDVLSSNGYYAGRGAVFAQVNPLGRFPVRPFVLGGIGWGEVAGPLIGGGLDVLPGNRRLGFRIAVEDYLMRIPTYDSRSLFKPAGHETSHQVSVKIGVLF